MKEKEHQSIEWKESWQDEYLKWICGYANAYGGTIYIGTDDDGRKIVERIVFERASRFVVGVDSDIVDNARCYGRTAK